MVQDDLKEPLAEPGQPPLGDDAGRDLEDRASWAGSRMCRALLTRHSACNALSGHLGCPEHIAPCASGTRHSLRTRSQLDVHHVLRSNLQTLALALAPWLVLLHAAIEQEPVVVVGRCPVLVSHWCH